METIRFDSSIRDAAEAVLAGGCRTVFIVDGGQTLVGSVTEGDLVRAFLNGVNLGALVRHIMNSNPVFVLEEYKSEEVASLMSLHGHSAIPVVDESRKVLRILRQTDNWRN